MKPAAIVPRKRCAIYTRKSSEEGLEQEYNSLEAQRDAAMAFIVSQKHEGWIACDDRYDDGGFLRRFTRHEGRDAYAEFGQVEVHEGGIRL